MSSAVPSVNSKEWPVVVCSAVTNERVVLPHAVPSLTSKEWPVVVPSAVTDEICVAS